MKENLILTNDPSSTGSRGNYALVCPKCKRPNIWPRGVSGSENLNSNHDSIEIHLECEDCNTALKLVMRKNYGFELSLESDNRENL